MLLLRLTLLIVVIFSMVKNAYCITFDEAITQDSFQVKISQEGLEKLNKASVLVISCVDFRLRNETEKLLREHLHLLDDYDEISLPGASLAFVESSYPCWNETIVESVDLLKKLHGIKNVIFIDHRECGAYKLIKGEQSMASKEIETDTHRQVFREVKAKMKKLFPELKVYTLLMDLNGVVENIKD